MSFFFLFKSAYLIALLYSLLPPVVLHEGCLCDMITGLRLGREIVLGVLPSVNLQFTRIAVDFSFSFKTFKKTKNSNGQIP